ncbi:MAG: extracellular solute-binding protein [Lachnospiraceae bacterium]|nr:extracellular solute-binding protein [Lachnospiraceae bacterium]
MKLHKRWLALILALAMTLSLAACAVAAPAASAPAEAAPAVEEAAEAVEETAEAVEETAEEVVEEAAEAVEETAEEATEEAAAEWDGEITDIDVMLFDLRGVGENSKPIVDAMNAITEKTCGVRANIMFVPGAEFQTQTGLIFSSGENLDVISLYAGTASFASLIANGQLMDITELMQNEGKETYDMMSEYIAANTVDGKIYGIPPYRNYGNSIYLIMRKDILDDLGLTEKAQNLTDWAGVEEIFQAVTEQGNISAVGSGRRILTGTDVIFPNGSFDDKIMFDTLGDSILQIFTDDEGNVSLLPENENYRIQQDMVRDWYNAGYVYKDSPITDDHPDTLMKAGSIFSSVQVSEMGVETSKREATGYEVICAELARNRLTSATVNKFGIGVPVISEEPEAAVRWINALYTDPALVNLLYWGIEGEDYVITETGEAAYPEGIDPSNVKYHSVDFLLGNYFNALPWQGNGADFRQRAYDFLKGSETSPYIGFAINLGELQNTLTGLNSVYEKYRSTIQCGTYTDEDYDAYLAELKTADVDTYIAEFQNQLTNWMNNN